MMALAGLGATGLGLSTGSSGIGHGLPNASPLAVSAARVSVTTGPTVLDTLVVSNGTVVPGNFIAQSGEDPVAAAYDPDQHELFVVDQGNGTGTSGVSVLNDSTDQVVGFLPAGGASPVAVAYDPARQQLFVANQDSDDVTIFDTATNALVKTVPVGTSPCALVYDTEDGDIYVANFGSENLTIIDGSSDSVGTPPAVVVGYHPDALAYSPAFDELFVANLSSDPSANPGNVSVVNASTDSVARNVTVGDDPVALAWDASEQELFVADRADDSVTVLSGNNSTVEATVPVGASPTAIAVDPAEDAVFVGNAGSANLTVLDDQNNLSMGSVAVLAPSGLAYDLGTGTIYDVSASATSVEAINGTTDLTGAVTHVGSRPFGIAYDPSADSLYIGDSSSSELDTVSPALLNIGGSLNLTFEPTGLAYDDGTGAVYVGSSGPPGPSEDAVVNTSHDEIVGNATTGDYPIASVYDPSKSEIFTANYLDGSVSVVDDSTQHAGTNPSVGLNPSGLAFDPADGDVFVAVTGANEVVVLSDNTNQIVSMIAVGSQPVALAYDPNTGEVFVANNGSDSVSVILTSDDAVVDTIAVGAEPSAVAFDSLNDEVYVTNLGSGNLSAISDSTDQVVGSVPVGIAPGGIAYDPLTDRLYVTNLWGGTVTEVAPGGVDQGLVQFSETGLPAATEWAVTLNGSVESSISSTLSFSEPFGTYPYNVSGVNTSSEEFGVDPASGSVTIGLGTASGVSLAFYPSAYAVEFNETGLPVGTEWNVTLGNDSAYFSTPAFTFFEANGTYNFSVGNASSYEPTPTGGTVTVAGVSQEINVTFALNVTAMYQVTFLESGLASGTTWWVNLTGELSYNSTLSYLYILTPNGTYPYTASAPGEHTVLGTLIVNGLPTAPVEVSFASSPSGTPPSAPGPSDTELELIGLGIVIVVLIAIVASIRWIGRKRQRPPGTPVGPPNVRGRPAPEVRPPPDDEDDEELAFGMPDEPFEDEDDIS